MRFRVCDVSQLPDPGEMRGYPVEGLDVPILIANVDGELRAASSMCPHEDVSLLGGTLKGGELVCPGHGYSFDLDTGDCSHDPDLCLPRYSLEAEGSAIYAQLRVPDGHSTGGAKKT